MKPENPSSGRFVGLALLLGLVIAIPTYAQEHARLSARMECSRDRLIYNGNDIGVGNCEGVDGQRWAKRGVAWDLEPGWYVDSDNPPCGDRYGDDYVRIAARIIAAYYSGGTSEAAGEWSPESLYAKIDAFTTGVGGDFARHWRSLHNIQDRSRCQLLIVTVPVPKWRISLVEVNRHEDGFTADNECFFATVDNTGTPNRTEATCPVGWSAFEQLSIEESENGQSVVAVMAKNWSADRRRSPALYVKYLRP